MRTTYVFRDGQYYDKKTGEPMKVDRSKVVAPMVMGDVPEHIAPDGTVISSRSHRDELRKRKGLVPYENLSNRPKGKYTNKRFCEKRGMRPSEEAKEWLGNKHTEAAKRAKLI